MAVGAGVGVGVAVGTGVGVAVGVGVGIGVAVGVGAGVGVAVGVGVGISVAVGAGVGVESSPHARAMASRTGSKTRARMRFISMVLQEISTFFKVYTNKQLYHVESLWKQPLLWHAYGTYLKRESATF